MLPIEQETLDMIIGKSGIVDIKTATIRQICALAAALEKSSGEKFVHLEIGNPGLPPEEIGVEAEIQSLRQGIANKYPNINGIPALKEAGSKFLKAFFDIDVAPNGIVPTVGSMQGSFTMMMLLKLRDPEKDTMLFINPGFPAQRNQAKLLGMNAEAFDIYDYREEKLRGKLESILQSGRVTAMIYSNPNNPAWTNLTEDELKIIGEMATRYDAIVVEDLAYLGMDFRTYAGNPFEEPFIPTVAKYTDNYILLVSSSKIFSYAGQRIAVVCMSDKVAGRQYPFLVDFFEMPTFGDAYIYGVLYTASSGTSHSAQYAMAAMLEAAYGKRLDFVGNCREYGRRARRVKRMFLDNGFHLVYDTDGGRPLADGFFFTVGYGGMNSEELQLQLMRHGISSISLPCTGSEQDGVRICISSVSDGEETDMLEQRLKAFSDEHRL